MQHSHLDGSDLTGSNAVETEDDTDPSKEAEDRSCWVTVTGVSAVGVRGGPLVASATGARDRAETQSPGEQHTLKGFLCNRVCVSVDPLVQLDLLKFFSWRAKRFQEKSLTSPAAPGDQLLNNYDLDDWVSTHTTMCVFSSLTTAFEVSKQ